MEPCIGSDFYLHMYRERGRHMQWGFFAVFVLASIWLWAMMWEYFVKKKLSISCRRDRPAQEKAKCACAAANVGSHG